MLRHFKNHITFLGNNQGKYKQNKLVQIFLKISQSRNLTVLSNFPFDLVIEGQVLLHSIVLCATKSPGEEAFPERNYQRTKSLGFEVVFVMM